MISSHHDAQRGIIVHVASGPLTYDEICATLERFYSQEQPCQRVLWDGRQATLARLSSRQLRDLADYPSRLDPAQPPQGRRAILVASKLDFGLARIIELLRQHSTSSMRHRLRAFQDEAAALAWLLEEESGPCEHA
ncbi:MAG: hypothetical protein ACOCXA_07220 [Planctomycetota bacterium]